jgi:hypothetical protein
MIYTILLYLIPFYSWTEEQVVYVFDLIEFHFFKTIMMMYILYSIEKSHICLLTCVINQME